MTPKDKAKELFEKCLKITYNKSIYTNEMSKELALMMAEEILKQFGLPSSGASFYTSAAGVEYWEKVKNEISLL